MGITLFAESLDISSPAMNPRQHGDTNLRWAIPAPL
jgi:hypothetical protein